MDADWFKAQHRRSGISQSEAARRMRRSPTFFSRLYLGKQTLKLHEAQQLAGVLGVPVADVLRRAGLNIAPEDAMAPAAFRPKGFGESDVAPLGPDAPRTPEARAQGLSQSVWMVRNAHMAASGYLPGDSILVDMNAAPRKGDAVVAQVYDWSADDAVTVLRLYLPPYLVRPGLDAETPLAVDGERVLIKGVVVAQWRRRIEGG